MPKYNCCVPGCTNSHRNKPSGFKFYCLPTDLELRKKYDVLIRNDNLKVSSIHTRICCEHWEGGQKLSRTHLPSIFPWTESKRPRRVISKASQEAIDKYKRKRRKNPIETRRTEFYFATFLSNNMLGAIFTSSCVVAFSKKSVVIITDKKLLNKDV